MPQIIPDHTNKLKFSSNVLQPTFFWSNRCQSRRSTHNVCLSHGDTFRHFVLYKREVLKFGDKTYRKLHCYTLGLELLTP